MQKIFRRSCDRNPGKALVGAGLLIAVLLVAANAGLAAEILEFVAGSLWEVAPLIVPGIILAAWVSASGASGQVAKLFDGNAVKTVLAASVIGAVTPVCGVTVLPLMVGLLAAGVPLAPVMAFWLSSPVTDPAMLAATAATLGWGFAVGKTLSAFCLGLMGGTVTNILRRRGWVLDPLRRGGFANMMSGGCQSGPVRLAVWSSAGHRGQFFRSALATTRLVLMCLIPAFAAEYMLNDLLRPESLSSYVGVGNWWSVPLAVFVGAPAYLDGFAALPLTRSLLNHGMSQGAALAFLVSGGVVSIWGAMAIFPVLKLKSFLLYLVMAVLGSLMVGWGAELLVMVAGGK